MPDDPPTQAPTGTRDTLVAGETTGQLVGRETTAFAPVGYDVGTVIGRGGMGEVVVARDREIGRDVAIKRMRGGDGDPDAVERFLREARIQARLDHPAIVPVHAIGRDAAGRPYFTMKRLAGTTLYDVIAAGGDPRRQLRAFVDVCLAIEFAHARGVIHRDLKPANIMLGDYGEVYVLDWGVAREGAPVMAMARSDHPRATTAETAAGALLGTIGYMPPEQIQASHTVGPAADVYALGAMLFEILTGGRPLHPLADALASTLATPTASPLARAPDRDVPPELDHACTAALAEDPAARPTARALADRVQGYLDGDRDLARRRALAADHLARADAAIATGDAERRIVALRAANHALALDPESSAAATTVMSLVLAPPDRIPEALARHLRDDDMQMLATQAPAMLATLATPLLFWPIALWLGVKDWRVLVFGTGLILTMMGLTLSEAKRRRPVIWPWLVCNVLLLAVFSRLFGPWVVVPTLAAGSAVTLFNAPGVGDRPGLILGSLALGYFAPIVLEALGVLGQTWSLAGGKLTTWSAALDWHGPATLGFLLVTNAAAFLVIGVFARALVTARKDAHRRIEIQRWHLAQLVPAA